MSVMTKMIVGLACAAIVGGIGYPVLVHLALRPTCDLSVMEDLRSPNGRFVSTVFRRDCGATTDFVTAVVLHRDAEAFGDEREALILNGAVPVSQTWVTDEELHLRLPPSARIFRAIDQWNEVKISFEQ